VTTRISTAGRPRSEPARLQLRDGARGGPYRRGEPARAVRGRVTTVSAGADYSTGKIRSERTHRGLYVPTYAKYETGP